MKQIFKLLLILIVAFALWIIYLLYFSTKESIAIELSEEIEKFKTRTGHYPNCDNSVELIDSLQLNGNEWYPEYFSYHLDSSKKYYEIKIHIHDKEVYDSRTQKVSRQN
jgi:hypothetical protein